MNTTPETTKETQIFSQLAHSWWDETGPFKALHEMNPARLQYIVSHIRTHFKNNTDINILDVGCGGGLVCEPLARLGYTVIGIDQSAEAIHAARHHATEQGLNIHYSCASVEDLEEQYDIITLLEVLEHVEHPEQLLKSTVERLAPGGLIFFSTLNRTVFSYAAGILLAENVLKWAPKGAHQWSHFLKPSEIIIPLQALG
ncbi:MAG: bifunctional 2-polyprenyl-6-hydroxyphenol methylase/3-demethylubiquinol 3-O-methyltransferase UbiG, partial [Alphaproteobacteria bacterium]|nr:bifunctional 2-polyprenyl-6-hydroxyphenol methylase/3-demethylubiquinol 3-O-methyltransferase UbiG [Alphaproteobacteria bacterium]